MEKMKKMKEIWNRTMSALRTKKLTGLILLGCALLLLGATGVRSISAADEARINAERCEAAAKQLAAVAQDDTRWQDMAERSPDFCIRAGHTVLRPVSEH